MANLLDIHCAKASVHVELNRRNARAFMRQKGPMEGALQERFESIAKDCEEHLPIYGTWKTFAVEPLADTPGLQVLATSLALPGNGIAKRLAGATHAVLMAFTLGAGFEREAGRLGALSTLDALMFDACASSLVDDGADAFQAEIVEELAALGYEPTGLRYSPGYGDLALGVQPGFLDVLDAGRNIGVYVTEENLLVPVKSITAILGVKPIDCGEDEG